MVSFQDARDEAMEDDEAMEARSSNESGLYNQIYSDGQK